MDFTGVNTNNSGTMASRVVGYMKGISLTPTATLRGDGVADRPLCVGIRRESTEGSPSAPCLAIDIPQTWRFRWGVRSGTRSMSVSAKQVSNVAGKRPRLVIRANPAIGVNSDVVADAPSGTGWVTIGPVSVTPTSNGMLWVELCNMDTDTFNSTAYFDHILAT